VYAEAKPISKDLIPVVDISPLINDIGKSTGAGDRSIEVAEALHAASEGLGFIYVKGHGIQAEVIEAAQQMAYRFFRSPDERKGDVLISDSHRGWLRPGAAKMQDNAKVDLKESFIWGQQDSAGNSLADHPLRGQNLWPEFVPGLQNAAMEYFDQAHKVAFALMTGFALGLKLPSDFFLKSCSRPLSRASFVYYPAQPEESGLDWRADRLVPGQHRGLAGTGCQWGLGARPTD